MTDVDPQQVVQRIEEIRTRLADVAWPVRLVAVTKRFPADRVVAAIAGHADAVGENYAQELVEKQDELGRAAKSIPWHLIGAVQRNKIKKLVGRVAVWHTIDRIDLLDELAKRNAGGDVLIQVNASGEAQKNGADPQDVVRLVEHGLTIGLPVVGLMSVGVAGDLDRTASAFATTRALMEGLGLAECSMGMSADLDVALSEGTTMVRIGSAIFGTRPVP